MPKRILPRRKRPDLARRNFRHGFASRGKLHPLYYTWRAMRKRCANPNSRDWKWYGARGIRVCKRWQNFANFLADVGERPKGFEIDRRNNDGNYSPKNFRWATRSEQIRNSRTCLRGTK